MPFSLLHFARHSLHEPGLLTFALVTSKRTHKMHNMVINTQKSRHSYYLQSSPVRSFCLQLARSCYLIKASYIRCSMLPDSKINFIKILVHLTYRRLSHKDISLSLSLSISLSRSLYSMHSLICSFTLVKIRFLNQDKHL